MICLPCRKAGEDNKNGNGFDASLLHDFCDNLDLHPGSAPNWCDCQHVTVPFEEPYGCVNCDGRKCMDCVCRIWHDECKDDCPECCDPCYCMEPMAAWERSLMEGIRE